MLSVALLIALLVGSWLARRHLRLPGGRNAAYATAAAKQVAGFAIPALSALALAGRIDAAGQLPPELRVAGLYAGTTGLIAPLAIGAVLGMIVGALLARWRWRRSGRRGPMFGELGWLIPRDRRDLRWAALLAVVAGVSEELYFRLALPLLAALATGSFIAGQAVALTAFAAVHRYQGWTGVIATGTMGLLLTLLYLASGSLWLAMAAHILIDLNSLVLIPAVTGAFRR